MARTINQILSEIGEKYISFDAVADGYGLEQGKTFEEQFAKVSIEYIIFYTIAFCLWAVEKLFDLHKSECEQLLDEKKPHRLKWYRDKALAFQYGRALVTDTDYYDNSDVSEQTLATEQVVKYAAVEEQDGKLFIKVAGDTNGTRAKISAEQFTALQDYFNNHIKDAGVKLAIINQQADAFRCELDIYYNPMVLDSNGYRLDGGGNETVQDAVKNYIENLPFNGEYSNMALIDVLQNVDGVVFRLNLPYSGDCLKRACCPMLQ